jgi:hypothetical protein
MAALVQDPAQVAALSKDPARLRELLKDKRWSNLFSEHLKRLKQRQAPP